MKYNGVRFALSVSEIGDLLFKRKKCPNCNNLLNVTLNHEIRESLEFRKSVGVGPIKNYFVFYKCEECGYFNRTDD